MPSHLLFKQNSATWRICRWRLQVCLIVSRYFRRFLEMSHPWAGVVRHLHLRKSASQMPVTYCGRKERKEPASPPLCTSHTWMPTWPLVPQVLCIGRRPLHQLRVPDFPMNWFQMLQVQVQLPAEPWLEYPKVKSRGKLWNCSVRDPLGYSSCHPDRLPVM